MQFDNSLQMMKRFLILCCAMMVGALGAQKSKDIGFVDSDVILAKMPEYRAAQKDLDDLGAKFQGEAQQMQTALDQMIRDFQSEEILLTADQRRQKKRPSLRKKPTSFNTENRNSVPLVNYTKSVLV